MAMCIHHYWELCNNCQQLATGKKKFVDNYDSNKLSIEQEEGQVFFFYVYDTCQRSKVRSPATTSFGSWSIIPLFTIPSFGWDDKQRSRVDCSLITRPCMLYGESIRFSMCVCVCLSVCLSSGSCPIINLRCKWTDQAQIWWRDRENPLRYLCLR